MEQQVQNADITSEELRLLEEKLKQQNDLVSRQYKLLKIQADQLKAQAEELKKRNRHMIDMLGAVVEYRNMEDGGHIQRVQKFTDILAHHVMDEYPEYKLSEEMIENIVSAAALHDIGKIAIPDSILLKPGKYTSEEYEYMKSHSLRGAEIIASITEAWDDDYREIACNIAKFHHERYDGHGYPEGLSGEEIPICAQLVAIADIYDSLISERVYKSAYTTEEAFQMIVGGECGVFSPKLIESFRNSKKEYEAVASKKS